MNLGVFSTSSSQDQSGMEEMMFGMTLSKKQRLYGFAICFVLGFIISCLSTLFLIAANFTGFAVMYTFGNIISLFSTGFLIGPKRQFQNMFDEKRRITSIVFICAMLLTLIFAFATGITILVLISCAIQFLALFWYCASYIPFARDMITSFFGRTFSS